MPYPTREEIMAGTVLHRPEVIAYFKEWKRTVWNTIRRNPLSTEDDRFNAIAVLLGGIALRYRKPVNVVWEPGTHSSFYVPSTRMIHIVGKPSIVTALHELGHHLFPRGTETARELKACRWSVRLYAKVFPRLFAAMRWEGHMLRMPLITTAAPPEVTSIENS